MIFTTRHDQNCQKCYRCNILSGGRRRCEVKEGRRLHKCDVRRGSLLSSESGKARPNTLDQLTECRSEESEMETFAALPRPCSTQRIKHGAMHRVVRSVRETRNEPTWPRSTQRHVQWLRVSFIRISTVHGRGQQDTSGVKDTRFVLEWQVIHGVI